MRKLMMLLGAAAMTATLPAMADAQGRGKGAAMKAQAGAKVKTNRAGVRSDARASLRNDRWVRTTDGRWVRAEALGGNAACPPGLANRDPACMPPGLARQVYRSGQRLPTGYRYVAVPQQFIGQIPAYDPNRYRYYYDQQRVYVVDPATSLITSVIDLVL